MGSSSGQERTVVAVIGDDTVDESPVSCLATRELATEEQELFGAGNPDEPRQQPAKSKASEPAKKLASLDPPKRPTPAAKRGRPRRRDTRPGSWSRGGPTIAAGMKPAAATTADHDGLPVVSAT